MDRVSAMANSRVRVRDFISPLVRLRRTAEIDIVSLTCTVKIRTLIIRRSESTGVCIPARQHV